MTHSPIGGITIDRHGARICYFDVFSALMTPGQPGQVDDDVWPMFVRGA